MEKIAALNPAPNSCVRNSLLNQLTMIMNITVVLTIDLFRGNDLLFQILVNSGYFCFVVNNGNI